MLAAAEGDISETIRLLAGFPGTEVQTWCIEHGQTSGRLRHRLLGRRVAPQASPALGPRNPTAALAREVYRRDSYHCRFCALPVIPPPVLKRFGRLMGEAVFPVGRTNLERHGAALVFRGAIDHVVPWSLGGATASENLVTACWACNYGKSRYTLDQIGLTDPRLRPAVESDWDGGDGLRVRSRRISGPARTGAKRSE
ncbi:MAG: HNH endonuclease signature motif containing protein [Gemmatimonadota bacterium]